MSLLPLQDKWLISRQPAPDNSDLYETTVRDASDPSKIFSFRTSLVQGVPCLQSLNSERYERINAGIKYRPSDILVSTYPKCGTTWSEQCVLLLTHAANPELINPVHKNSYSRDTGFGKIWPEAMILQSKEKDEGEFQHMSWEGFDSAPAPRILKAHLPIELMLGANGDLGSLPVGMKVVVVVRNPYDACVSSYYHAFNPHKNGWPFEAWAATFLNGYAMFGCYFAWVRGWYEQYKKYPDRVIWVQYEEMKQRPMEETRRLSQFLGTPTDESFIQSVVELSSFESMQDQANKKGGDVIGHLRKGVVGDWRNHFTPDLLAAFKERVHKELDGIEVVSDLE